MSSIYIKSEGIIMPSSSEGVLHMPESYPNEEEQRFFFICIQFGSRKVRRLNLA